MRGFDELPPAFRDLLNYAPMVPTVGDVQAWLHKHGHNNALVIAESAIFKHCGELRGP